MDFPDFREFSPSVITSFGQHTGVMDILDAIGTGAPASAIWPIANRAIYVPFVLNEKTTVYQAGWINGATTNTSGNVSIAIYDLSKAQLIEARTTQSATINAMQLIDITDTTLAPGNYYMGMSCDNITSTFFRFSTLLQRDMQVCGIQVQATAYPLPNPASFSNVTASFVLPCFGLATKSVI